MLRVCVFTFLIGSLLSSPARADITDIQAALKAVGCYDGDIDGKKSLALRTSIRCFQKGIDVTPDGTLSTEEVARLLDMSEAGDTVERQERYEAEQIRGEDLPEYIPPPVPKESNSMAVLPTPETDSSNPSQRSYAGGTWVPSERGVSGAIKRAIARELRQMDAMSNACSTLSNSLEAIMCLRSGLGKYNSRTFSLHVHNVRVEGCVRAEDGDAFCRYSARASIDDNGAMGPVGNVLSGLAKLGVPTYGRFRIGTMGRWELVQNYDHCSWDEERVRCTWTQRQ